MNPSHVRVMNHASQRGLVLAPEGYVAFEVLDGELTIGDVVDGNFMSHGPCVWDNLSTGRVVRVYVQRLMVTMESARTFLFLAEPSPEARGA